jgi:hypothetical protein
MGISEPHISGFVSHSGKTLRMRGNLRNVPINCLQKFFAVQIGFDLIKLERIKKLIFSLGAVNNL